MNTTSLSGGCLCGAVRYTARGEAQQFWHCHCQRCRKASGTGHASNLFVSGSLKWESGEHHIVQYKVPEAKRFTNTFCGTCGGRVPRFIEQAGMVFIPAGSLDQEPDFMPQGRIFSGSRTEWSCHDGDLPEFDEYPK
jgi:hypothetical protein